MRQSTTINISRFGSEGWLTPSGILNVPINVGSRRKFHLMTEDSLTLAFSLDEPMEFLVGDFVIDEVFGLFFLREKQLPTYNKATGGYDYQLRFDRAYWLWENHINMLTAPMDGATPIAWTESNGTLTLNASSISRVSGQFPYKRSESVWCLTNSLAYHVEQILCNILAADLTYYGSPYNARILPSARKAKEIRFINYDDTHICSALTQIANEFECEWWVTYEGNPATGYINFGKCELDNTPLDFELGINVETMQASRDLTNFANRIYAFGGTQNMPESYRKKLLLTIDNYETIGDHVVWEDTTRQIDPFSMLLDEGTEGVRPVFQFPMLSQGNVVSASTPGDNEIVNDTATSQYPGKSVVKYRMVARQTTDSSVETFGFRRDKEVQYNSFSAGLLFLMPASSSTKVDAELRLFLENADDATDKIYLSNAPYTAAAVVTNANASQEVRSVVFTDFVQGGSTTINGERTYKLVLEATITFRDVAVSFLNDTSYDYTLVSEFNRSLYLPVGKSFAARIVWDGNEYPVTFNPAQLVDGEDHAGAFELQSIYPGWDTDYRDGGVDVELLDYYAYAIPTSYFTDDTDDPSSLIGLGERRLRLPTVGDEDGVIIEDGYAEIDGVLEVQRTEMVVKNDSIFPKCYLKVTDVSTRQMKDTITYADDTEYQWGWTAYTIKAELVTTATDKTFPFKAAFVKEGEKLKASFLSDYNEQKAYSEMGVTWESHDGYLLAGMTFEVAFRDTFYGGEYTIIRNEDYGAKLPSGTLKPKVGDTFILTGWDVKALDMLNLVETAELQLVDFAKSYLKAMQEDGWLFRCSMMTDSSEPLYAEGTKVKVYHDALSGGYKQSRIIGYELKMDIPEDSPVYEVGETEAYSRIKAIERSLTSSDYTYIDNVYGDDEGGDVGVQYSVTTNYTNVTGNAPSNVDDGDALSVVLSPTTGHTLQSVAVTMGGVDITSTAYNSITHTISIASVTGNVVITASASIITFFVTTSLTNITSNAPAQVEFGDVLQVTLTPSSGYAIDASSVVVTMGGVTLSGVYSSGVVTINGVTGNVSITAEAAEILPYDAEVEYLQSDGNAYIDTGVKITSSLRVDLNVTILPTVPGNTPLFGGRVSSSSKNYSIYYYMDDNDGWQWRYSATSKIYRIANNMTKGDYHISNAAYVRTMVITGAYAGSVTATSTSFTTDLNFFIFGANNNGAVGVRRSDFYIKNFKLYDGSTLVRDYIAVRVGQVGYFYDKVSKNLFGNADGTGAFNFGNDKTT